MSKHHGLVPSLSAISWKRSTSVPSLGFIPRWPRSRPFKSHNFSVPVNPGRSRRGPFFPPASATGRYLASISSFLISSLIRPPPFLNARICRRMPEATENENADKYLQKRHTMTCKIANWDWYLVYQDSTGCSRNRSANLHTGPRRPPATSQPSHHFLVVCCACGRPIW